MEDVSDSMLKRSDSLMEETSDQQLFISEYTYSDEDNQYDRRSALDRHSSADVKDIPIVKIIENQAAQTENEASKPIVSYVQSLFRAGSVGSNVNWLSGSNAKKDQRRLNIENIGKITEPVDVIDALNRAVELKNSMYTQTVLDLITYLCEQDKTKTKSANLGAEGVCSIIDHLLGMNIGNITLVEAALRAMCSLITPAIVSTSTTTVTNIAATVNSSICSITTEAGVSGNRRRFSSAGSVYQIIKAASSHIADEIVLEWGLRVLFYLSLEPGQVQRIVACGGCDLLAHSLRTHSGCDDIVVWACRTLCHCILTLDAINTQDRIVCQDKLAQQHVLEVLISSFSEGLNTTQKLVAQWSLRTIGCLARRHERNMGLFVEMGICELLQSVQQRFSLEDEKIAESICWVIGNISFPLTEAQTRWGACGACAVVLTSLRKHINSEETVQEALRALRNLSYDHEGNLELLRGLEVAEIIMSVIRRHQESSGVVLQWIWYAVAALAEYRPLVLQLGDEEVCSAAVASLTRFSARADLVQWTALAIANLSTEIKLSTAFGEANCCTVLIHVLNEHRNDEDVAEEIFSAISNLSANSIENRANFHRASAELAMLRTLQKHEKSETVVESGLTAMANIVHNTILIQTPDSIESDYISTTNSIHAEHDGLLTIELVNTKVIEKIIHIIAKSDGCKILSKAMHRHAAVRTIAEMGSRALADIALYGCNEEERVYSDSLKGSSLTLKHIKHITIETVTHRAQLYSSTRGEESILLPLGQSAAPVALMAVLQNYIHDVSIVENTLLALDRIACCVRNIPILHTAGLDILLIHVLQTHFIHSPCIVNICYRLIGHFCIYDESKERIGKEAGGEVLLVSMAHNMSTALPAKLGSDAISALCLSPEFDAIAVMAAKDSLGPSYDELDAHHRTAMKATQQVDAADRPRVRSRSNSAPDEVEEGSVIDSAAAATNKMTRSLSSLFGWQSTSTPGAGAAGGGIRNKTDRNSSATTSGSGARVKSINTFEIMSVKANNAGQAGTAGGLLGYASAGAFVSKGLTDQEEEMHTAKALALSRKSNSAVLITNGVSTILLTILDKHATNNIVQISVLNALNSLALDATHRNELNHEGIFESIIKAFRECLRLPLSSTTTAGTAVQKLDESMLSLDDSEHGCELPIQTPADTTITIPTGAAASVDVPIIDQSVLSLEDDETVTMSRRVLLVLLNITIGTLCLPRVEEVEGLTSNTDNGFAIVNQNALGLLGACELVVECLKTNARDSLICEAALRAIFYLSRSNESNQLRLGVAGAVNLIIASLRTFFFKPQIVYYCCQCIAGLSHHNIVNAELFDDCDVSELLFKTMNMYMEQGEVVEAVCHAIYSLKDLNHRLGDLCKLMVDALRIHSESVTVTQFAFQAIASLSELQSNKVLLDKWGVCMTVTTALQKHVSSNSMLSVVFMKDVSNAAVAQWGCTAIYYLARGPESQNYQQKLVTAGACEAVTRALLRYSEYETISHACFRSLVVLLMNNAAYKSKLGSLGVCSCVVEAMHMFPYSAQVAKWGCRCVAVLAESHEANIARLGVSGACESIPVILQAHPSSEYVACAGCDVISFMSETLTNGFAARFGQAGGCEAVIAVLRTHSTNAHVVTRASIAIASLSRVKGNATWMGPSGACEALMAVMQAHHTDVSVSKFIISAMGNLCIIDNNRERLGTLGACEIIVASARIHMLDLDTAKAASLAMGKLCEHIFRMMDTEDPLAHLVGGASGDHQAGTVAAFTAHDPSVGIFTGEGTLEMLSGKPRSQSVYRANPLSPGQENSSTELEAAFQSLSEPTTGILKPSPSTSTNSLHQQQYAPASPTISPMTVSSGRNSPLPKPSPATTAIHMSAVAYAHASAGRRNRARLFDADYCTVLESLLSNHITDADAVRIISRTISIIAFGDACTAERDVLASVGCCKALAKALQLHEGNEGIGRGVCWAVKALTHHHHGNREEFRGYGICSSVLVVLRGFRYSKNAAETVQGAAAAIVNLCQDNIGNKTAMGVAGACEGLLEVMELHYRNIEVAYLCSKALFHVCDGNHENRLKISFSGAADILMTMIGRYPDEDRILDYIFSVMIGMCLGKVGQSRLGTVGVSKAVVAALYRYEKTSEYLVLLSCALVHTLAVHSVENQNKLASAGACKAIAAMAIRYAHSTTYHTINMSILFSKPLSRPGSDTNLDVVRASSPSEEQEHQLSTAHSAVMESTNSKGGSGTSTVSHTATTAGGAAASKHPLAEIIGELSVLKECCKAVVHLSMNHEANRQKLQATMLLDTLTSILSTAVPYHKQATAGISGNISEETLRWVRSAVDVLMGKI